MKSAEEIYDELKQRTGDRLTTLQAEVSYRRCHFPLNENFSVINLISVSCFLQLEQAEVYISQWEVYSEQSTVQLTESTGRVEQLEAELQTAEGSLTCLNSKLVDVCNDSSMSRRVCAV